MQNKSIFQPALASCVQCKIKDFLLRQIIGIIIHEIHYEKSDWSRAFNQFTRACELDMINAISAADIVFTSCQVQRLPGY